MQKVVDGSPLLWQICRVRGRENFDKPRMREMNLDSCQCSSTALCKSNRCFTHSSVSHTRQASFPASLKTAPGFCFPACHSSWRRAGTLNPLAGRVAPVGHQPSSVICSKRAGCERLSPATSGLALASLNHNQLSGRTDMAVEQPAEKLCHVTRLCEGRLSSTIRENDDPVVEGCVPQSQIRVCKSIE